MMVEMVHLSACRLALVGVMPEHYCVNSRHLLGEQQMKLRHLAKLGYTVVTVSGLLHCWLCVSRK